MHKSSILDLDLDKNYPFKLREKSFFIFTNRWSFVHWESLGPQMICDWQEKDSGLGLDGTPSDLMFGFGTIIADSGTFFPDFSQNENFWQNYYWLFYFQMEQYDFYRRRITHIVNDGI